MKIKISIFFYFLLTPLISISQENQLPEGLLCAPVLITTNIGSGSGVFLQDSLNIYLVTARHVIYDAAPSGQFIFKPQLLRLLFYPKNIVNGDSAFIIIDFRVMKDSLIKYDKEHDIAIIKIAHITDFVTGFIKIAYMPHLTIFNVTNINSWWTKDTRNYLQTKIGSDIYLFGYPSSIGLQQNPKFDYNRPLLRKGIVAGKYEKQKTIIIDSPTYFGNSGGPVFELKEESLVKSVTLIGIVSEYVPFYDQMQSTVTGASSVQVMNSGYSIITPIAYALDLIKGFK